MSTSPPPSPYEPASLNFQVDELKRELIWETLHGQYIFCLDQRENDPQELGFIWKPFSGANNETKFFPFFSGPRFFGPQQQIEAFIGIAKYAPELLSQIARKNRTYYPSFFQDVNSLDSPLLAELLCDSQVRTLIASSLQSFSSDIALCDLLQSFDQMCDNFYYIETNLKKISLGQHMLDVSNAISGTLFFSLANDPDKPSLKILPSINNHIPVVNARGQRMYIFNLEQGGWTFLPEDFFRLRADDSDAIYRLILQGIGEKIMSEGSIHLDRNNKIKSFIIWAGNNLLALQENYGSVSLVKQMKISIKKKSSLDLEVSSEIIETLLLFGTKEVKQIAWAIYGNFHTDVTAPISRPI